MNDHRLLEAKKDFLAMLKQAKIEDDDLENGDIRRDLVKILNHVVAFPELRDFFAHYFVEIVYSTESSVFGTPDVTEFCMHELRWQEVKTALEEKNNNPKRMQEKFFVDDVLKAFDDDWTL